MIWAEQRKPKTFVFNEVSEKRHLSFQSFGLKAIWYMSVKTWKKLLDFFFDTKLFPLGFKPIFARVTFLNRFSVWDCMSFILIHKNRILQEIEHE